MFVPYIRNRCEWVTFHGTIMDFYLSGSSYLECLIGLRIVCAMSLDSTPGDSIPFSS